ncbi:uncharacterized protein LOC114541735 [Dendronephthya gigantea]|uniref:uncharacterized protein LOC114541735 n=1 Tax=Dendronephthya gigantea TaxID=151771 RepID=UPI00106D9A23|nr:uncharacterized protein LOC114541735 [Dendronephthya gigantea]
MRIGEQQIERVTSHKLLGVFLSCDLSWNTHIDYIVNKANKRLYILRMLRKTKVGHSELVAVYRSVIRAILEYAVPVWAAIPEYLSNKVETLQKRAMRIINPGISYEDSLKRFGLEELFKRRVEICNKFAKDNKSSGPLSIH